MFPLTFATVEELLSALPGLLSAIPTLVTDAKNIIAAFEGKPVTPNTSTDAAFDAADTELRKHA